MHSSAEWSVACQTTPERTQHVLICSSSTPPGHPAASAPAPRTAHRCRGRRHRCRGTRPAQSPAGGRCQTLAAGRPELRRTACWGRQSEEAFDAATALHPTATQQTRARCMPGGQHWHCVRNTCEHTMAHHCTPAPWYACTAAPALLPSCPTQLKVPSGATPLRTGSSLSRSTASSSTAWRIAWDGAGVQASGVAAAACTSTAA